MANEKKGLTSPTPENDFIEFSTKYINGINVLDYSVWALFQNEIDCAALCWRFWFVHWDRRFSFNLKLNFSSTFRNSSSNFAPVTEKQREESNEKKKNLNSHCHTTHFVFVVDVPTLWQFFSRLPSILVSIWLFVPTLEMDHLYILVLAFLRFDFLPKNLLWNKNKK